MMRALLIRAGALSPIARLALLCLGLVAAGVSVVLLSPARARTAAIEARREALLRDVAQARTAAASLARSRLDGAELARRLELITQQLPTEREIAPLYRRLYDAASSAALAIALFQPQAARIQEHYTEIPIAVTAEGTYHQLGAFLARVAELPRVVIVSALKMTAVDRPAATLRAEMTLATYVYRPAGAPAAPGLAGAKPQVPAPIAGETVPRETASPAPAPSSSMTIALESPGALAQGARVSNAIAELAPPGPRHPARSVPAYASRDRRDPFHPAWFPAP